MSVKINRKKFLIDTAVSAAGLVLGSKLAGCSGEKKSPAQAYSIMSEVKKYRKFDAHADVGSDPGDIDKLLDYADRLGIDKMCISNPITNYSGTEPEGMDVVRRHNDIVIDSLKRYPKRFIGYLTLNPRYQKESLEEINRCVDQGLAGYKG